MVIEAVTGILGGKKAKKAAKKQKRIAQQVQGISQQITDISGKINDESLVQLEAARQQFALDKATNAEQRRQNRIQTIREARIMRSNILSSAANSGVGMGSSAISGGVGALTTQFGSTVGLSNVFNRLQDMSAAEQGKIFDSQGRVVGMQGDVNKLQGQVAQLTGQSQIVEANLAKSNATLGMITGIGKSVETIFNAAGGFTGAFGGGKVVDATTIFKRN